MNNLRISSYLVKPNDLIKNILTKLNTNRTLFVVDKNRKLIGSITDGDVRRFLIKKTSLSKKDNIKKIYNKNPFFSFIGYKPLELRLKISNKIKLIPIVNEQKKIVEIFDGNNTDVPIYAPYLQGNEKKYVNDAINSGWISSTGKFVKLFEDKFRKYLNCKYALSVSNGTSALQLALMSIGIKPGDEVIVPGLTFYAPMNAIISLGAIPVPVDVNLKNYCIDLDLIEKKITSKTKAIIIVHLYGFPLNLKRIKYLRKKYNLKVIEDCAEAIGSFNKKKHVGLNSDISTFSFFGNKTITTGEGGMVITNNRNLYHTALLKKNHGMSPKQKYYHIEHGLNFRMTNIQAAIGYAQLEQIRKILKKKRKIIDKYKINLKRIKYVNYQPEYRGDINSYWLFVIMLHPKIAKYKEDLIKIYKKNKYDVRRTFYSLEEMPIRKFYKSNLSHLKNSKIISNSCICLPSFPTLPIREVDKIVKILSEFITSKT